VPGVVVAFKGVLTLRPKWCKVCGICVAVCPVDNLAIVDGRLTPADRCTGCGLCEMHCPDFAISVERVADTAEDAALDKAAGGSGEAQAAPRGKLAKSPARAPEGGE
jgi:2-oxoglutarate ferredoxin oxidoreductase subunit delta